MSKEILIFTLAGALFLGALPALAAPADSFPSDAGRVSLTFDDGLKSTYTLAAPIMAEYGFVGTAYVYTQAQNKKWAENMSWTEVKDLQDKFGWEIGSHAFTHTDLTTITLAAAKNEISRSRTDLINHGLKVESFASPYGAYNTALVDYVSKYFSSHRTAWNLPNTYPINDYYLKARPVSPTTKPEEVMVWLDEAKANGEWLILYFHDLTEGTPTPENGDYNTADFRAILDYIKSKELPVLTTRDGVKSYATGENILVNGTFEDGPPAEAANWTRQSAKVKVLSSNRGNYPTTKRSIQIIGSAKDNTIVNLPLSVGADTVYTLKGFFRVTNYYGGDSTIWVSEFDAQNNYTGGQWLGGFNYNFLGTKTFDYLPTAGTDHIELFLLTHAGAKMTWEFDNLELKSK